MPYIVVVTGGRDFEDRSKMVRTFEALDVKYKSAVVLWHGAARGADVMAASVARSLGWKVVAVPVNESRDGPWPAAGNKRNVRMLVESFPDLVVAFPGPKSRGTWNCVHEAWRRGFKVLIP